MEEVGLLLQFQHHYFLNQRIQIHLLENVKFVKVLVSNHKPKNPHYVRISLLGRGND